uniref:Bromodomain associated domain-containing protein n=1 Tax=Oryza rufipogon TaxID=4529 RepID=A0A0E0NJN9_ORYRU
MLRLARGEGCLCNCRQGFEGILTWMSGAKYQLPPQNKDYPCTFTQYCNNTPGGFQCSCPSSMIDNGYRSGTGCTPLVPPCNDNPKGISGDGMTKGNGCQTGRKNFPNHYGAIIALPVTITTTASCIYWSFKKRERNRKRAELFKKNGGLLLQQRFAAFTSQGMMDLSARLFVKIEFLAKVAEVYKGILRNKNSTVFTVFNESQVEQFVNEISILSQIDHPNVVKLLGCCLETQVPLFAYSQPECSLLLPICNLCLLYQLFTENNILLDGNYVAKVSDFGASRSVPFDQTHMTIVQGTIGYLTASSQRRVIFGVVLAELLTTEKPVSFARPEDLRKLAMYYLVMLVNKGCILQAVKPIILAEAREEQLYDVAHLSIMCLSLKGEQSTMKEVASVLNGLRRSLAKDKAIKGKEVYPQNKNEEEEYLLPGSGDAVSRVSTAQILHSSGYTAAEPAALRALSDIAGRYVASLGRAASAIAEARGRTEPNLADLTLALEDHALGGFPGASDPARPVLRSGALSELAGFVRVVREVPFPKPVPRRGGAPRGKAWESFAAAGKEPPPKHVPRWLPRFPDKPEPEPEPKAAYDEATARWEARVRHEEEANAEEAVVLKPSVDGGGERRGVVPEKRGKVSFRVRAERKKRRVGLDQQ